MGQSSKSIISIQARNSTPRWGFAGLGNILGNILGNMKIICKLRLEKHAAFVTRSFL